MSGSVSGSGCNSPGRLGICAIRIFHQLPAALLLAPAEALLVGHRRRSSDVIAGVRSDVSRCIQLEALAGHSSGEGGIREIVRKGFLMRRCTAAKVRRRSVLDT